MHPESMPRPFSADDPEKVTPSPHDMKRTEECIGTMYSLDFVGDDDTDEREPGTYVTIRVPTGTRWSAGQVRITYVGQPETSADAMLKARASASEEKKEMADG